MEALNYIANDSVPPTTWRTIVASIFHYSTLPMVISFRAAISVLHTIFLPLIYLSSFFYRIAVYPFSLLWKLEVSPTSSLELHVLIRIGHLRLPLHRSLHRHSHRLHPLLLLLPPNRPLLPRPARTQPIRPIHQVTLWWTSLRKLFRKHSSHLREDGKK